MPLTDEEWVSFINEHNGVVDDVALHLEALVAACEGYRRGAESANGREEIQRLVRALTVVVGVQSSRVRERIKALSRRLNEMRALGEL